MVIGRHIIDIDDPFPISIIDLKGTLFVFINGSREIREPASITPGTVSIDLVKLVKQIRPYLLNISKITERDLTGFDKP